MLKQALMSALILFSGMAGAEDGVHQFYGHAYDLKTGKYIYTEVHEQRIEKDLWTAGSIAYFAPDGSMLAYKTLDFSQDPLIPVYRMDMKKSGYMESITSAGSSIVMAKRVEKGAPEEREEITKKPPMVADSGFHSFLVANFPSLLAGKKLNFKFVVAGNLDAFKFSAQRIEDGRVDGKVVSRFRIKPDSMLSLLVDPLEVSYDVASKKLVEYRGISNVHDPVTGKAYVARIIYPATPPADAPKSLPPLK